MANKRISDLTADTAPGDDALIEVETAAGDSRKVTMVNSIAGNVPVRTDATRGAAGTAGRVVFNSDDGALNIDDGTNWTLPDGTTT